MSPKEAAALLNIDLKEDLEEQVELVVFELKQKIYRQLDQLLLYPKWYKELQRITDASSALDMLFLEDKQATFTNFTNELNIQLPMLAFFNQYQVQRKEMALQFHRAQVPLVLQKILMDWSEVQKQYLAFWSNRQELFIEVQLTAQFDPQAILLILEKLKDKGVLFVNDLNWGETPELLQQYIARNQKIWAKLQLN
jgi:hypothetical protein